MVDQSFPCASLYVGDLHPETTESILYEKFNTNGNIISIRVCRDLVTRKSLGYAYVNYKTTIEAKNAMDNLNFEVIHGRPCRIMWSQRDPASRRSTANNIFIKNLDSSITTREIYDTFAIFGDITSCKVPGDENGVSKGFAFVNFLRENDAEKAIQAINGKMIRDKIVYVAKFVPRSQRNATSKEFLNCFIKNFSTFLDEADLKDLFGVYGDIVSAKVMVDENGVSKGFGFVSFRQMDEAAKAVAELNGRIIQDKPIYVGRAMKKSERLQEIKTNYEKFRKEQLQGLKAGVNLYIKNLGLDITEDRLRDEFAIFGNITSVKVMLNPENNVSKGFGFVSFSAPDEATRALSEMNGKIIGGKPLYVAIAQKKEDRIEHLRLQLNQHMQQTRQPLFNPGLVKLINPSNQQTFINPNMPTPWPGNIPYVLPRHNIMGLQPGQQPQNMFINQPMMLQQRNPRPITGNVNMNQIRPQYRTMVSSRSATIDEKIKNDFQEESFDLSLTSKIANADNVEAKQLLGEAIYPLVVKQASLIAKKITGMLLELDNAELLYMVQNEESIGVKFKEAISVLQMNKTES